MGAAAEMNEMPVVSAAARDSRQERVGSTLKLGRYPRWNDVDPFRTACHAGFQNEVGTSDALRNRNLL